MAETVGGQYRQTRAERLERKRWRVLRCEWCNRWTEVPLEFWKHFMGTGFKDEIMEAHERAAKRQKIIFFCRRGRCIRSRPERRHPFQYVFGRRTDERIWQEAS